MPSESPLALGLLPKLLLDSSSSHGNADWFVHSEVSAPFKQLQVTDLPRKKPRGGDRHGQSLCSGCLCVHICLTTKSLIFGLENVALKCNGLISTRCCMLLGSQNSNCCANRYHPDLVRPQKSSMRETDASGNMRTKGSF